jgi:hypothetical protein
VSSLRRTISFGTMTAPADPVHPSWADLSEPSRHGPLPTPPAADKNGLLSCKTVHHVGRLAKPESWRTRRFSEEAKLRAIAGALLGEGAGWRTLERHRQRPAQSAESPPISA